MTRLFLMRHAEAFPSQPNQSDAARELTPAGRRDAGQVGRWLAEQNLDLRLLSSPFVRAEQTARELLACLPATTSLACDPHLTYLALPEQILPILVDNRSPALLIVGHMPVVSQWLALLTDNECLREFETAALVELELLAPLVGGARFIRYLSPSMLA